MKKRFSYILTLAVLAGAAWGQVDQKGDSSFKVKPKVRIQAYGFSLKDVRLLDGTCAY